MTKVTITFDYDESRDGKLGSEDFDCIMETLMQFGSNIKITESEEI